MTTGSTGFRMQQFMIPFLPVCFVFSLSPPTLLSLSHSLAGVVGLKASVSRFRTTDVSKLPLRPQERERESALRASRPGRRVETLVDPNPGRDVICGVSWGGESGLMCRRKRATWMAGWRWLLLAWLGKTRRPGDGPPLPCGGEPGCALCECVSVW